MTEDPTQNMIEIELPNPDSFNIVRETLTRIGVAHKKESKLYQSVHILHKRGRYFLVSFKEMFVLDGKPATLTDNDIARRNTIAGLLEDWNLVRILNEEIMEDFADISEIKIIPFKEKHKWELVPKYTIGSKKETIL